MTEQTQPTDAEHIPHTCGGFSGAFFAQHKRMPSAQEIWDAAIRSYRDLNRTPAGAGEPYGYVYTAQVAPIVGDERKVERTVFTRNKPPCNALALYTTPQPTQAQAGAVPLTSEQERAIREAYESAGSESYFGARPQIDTNDRRRVFKAGFERGWDAKTGADHA